MPEYTDSVGEEPHSGHNQVDRRWLTFLLYVLPALLDELCTSEVEFLLSIGINLRVRRAQRGVTGYVVRETKTRPWHAVF